MPVVKGGVWTNAEDEILKVAVAKYGLNQWARISSLQHRKTAKQCKARWTQWLDPAIKKTEWAKEEDEKLLHLAKILPQQWLTIAPIVGRTAQQCIERYDKLLSDAQAKEGEDLGLTGPEGGEGQAPTADDVRRLRPGEVDPDPETKPARPDTVDMDEDEKEMLSEARARLANTQGKKAKRKARERQLEESRRLAALQKRRELKNAGINIKITSRKKGEMDYNADIPFEKKAAPGFYDTREEMDLNEKEREAFDPRKQQMATKRKADPQEEDAENKRRKAEKNPNAALAAAAKAGQMQKIREAERSAKRRSLALPAPQVGESELEDIVKMGMAGERASRLAEQGDNEATRDLVGRYSEVVGSTPIRTPRAPPQEDHIANEVRNIHAMTNTQSSLLGGENTPLHEGSSSTGYEGAAPRSNAITTPNPMATPFRRPNGALAATPARGQAPGATPIRTPRDTFAINAQGGGASSLQSRLAALPKPVATEWELEIPDEQATGPSDKAKRQEDAAERDRRNAAIAEAASQAELRRRSQVLQRRLPRPMGFDAKAFGKHHHLSSKSEYQTILAETARLISHDNFKYPIAAGKIGKAARPLEIIDDEYLNRARKLLEEEAQKALPEDDGQRLALPEVYRASLVPYGYDEEDGVVNDVQSVASTLGSLQLSIMDRVKRCNEKEKKLSLLLGGYQQRAKALRQKTIDAGEKLEKARADQNAFLSLQVQEDAALTQRLTSLREEVTFLSKREREVQHAYRLQKQELEDLETQAPGK